MPSPNIPTSPSIPARFRDAALSTRRVRGDVLPPTTPSRSALCVEPSFSSLLLHRAFISIPMAGSQRMYSRLDEMLAELTAFRESLGPAPPASTGIPAPSGVSVSSLVPGFPLAPSIPTGSQSAPTSRGPIGTYQSSRPAAIPLSLANGHPPPASSSNDIFALLRQGQLAVPMSSNQVQPRLPSRSAGSSAAVQAQLPSTRAGRETAIHAHAPPPAPSLPPRPNNQRGRASQSRVATTSVVPPQSRRRRGPAGRLPSTVDSQALRPTDKRSAVRVDEQNIEYLKVALNIHTHSTQTRISLPYHNKGGFVDAHNEHGLYHVVEYPMDAAVVDVLKDGARRMQEHHAQWHFGAIPPAYAAGMLEHEKLDLRLLGSASMRGIRVKGGYMLEHVPMHLHRTLRELYENRRFTVNEVTVNNGMVDIHMMIAREGASCIVSVNDTLPDRHVCITTLLNARWIHDPADSSAEADYQTHVCECEALLGRWEEMEVEENLVESEDGFYVPPTPTPSGAGPLTRRRAAEEREVAFSSPPASTIAAAALRLSVPRPATPAPAVADSPLPATVPATPETSIPSSPGTIGLSLDDDDTNIETTPADTVPPAWANEWIQQRGTHEAVFQAPDLFNAICAIAIQGQNGAVGRLAIRGTSVAHAARVFSKRLAECVQQHDISPMFTPIQHWAVRTEDNSRNSFGDGPRREILLQTLHSLISDSTLVREMSGKRLSIALVSEELGDAYFLPAHLLRAKVFGALVVFLLANGIVPDALEPALLQFALNNGDPASLTPAFIKEFYSDIDRAVTQYYAAGPHADFSQPQYRDVAAHLSIWQNIDAREFSRRSVTMYNKTGSEMVLAGTIGPKGIAHPMVRAFVEGVNLPFRNGITVAEIIRSDPTDTASHITRGLASVIHGPTDLDPWLTVTSPEPDTLVRFAGVAGLSDPVDLRELVSGFLGRTGVPSPLSLASASYDSSIPIDHIDKIHFRARLLCRVATGFDQLMLKSFERINIAFVNPGDAYHPNANDGDAIRQIMQAGKVAVRSCFHEVKIPIPHLDQLLEATYPVGDLATLQDAIDNWLLVELLELAGRHSFA
uniref:Uncharacterized protein n=1 Tax=Mycena chlorophos TaxID=658473 RepID=A0ABQ0LR11_MYCCL|nr:predicted protein [Mycena chlorophos]